MRAVRLRYGPRGLFPDQLTNQRGRTVVSSVGRLVILLTLLFFYPPPLVSPVLHTALKPLLTVSFMAALFPLTTAVTTVTALHHNRT